MKAWMNRMCEWSPPELQTAPLGYSCKWKVGLASGFTLVELLVVITALCLLAAALLPVFARAWERKRQTVCDSNLRQLGSSFQQYVQDNDGIAPGAYCGVDGNGYKIGGWVAYDGFPVNDGLHAFAVGLGSLYPYVRNTQVYICPNDAEGQRTGNSYAISSCLLSARSQS